MCEIEREPTLKARARQGDKKGFPGARKSLRAVGDAIRGVVFLLGDRPIRFMPNEDALGRVQLDIELADGRASGGLAKGGRAGEGAEEDSAVQGGHILITTVTLRTSWADK